MVDYCDLMPSRSWETIISALRRTSTDCSCWDTIFLALRCTPAASAP